MYKLTVVPSEPEKTTQRLDGFGQRPLLDRLDLVIIHGHHVIGYDMSQVMNTPLAEEALGTLEGEAVGAQRGEHRADMLKMFGPRTAEDVNVVEEHQDAAAEERLEHLVHERLER